MIVLIDNYDSFTYNLFHYLGELGAERASCIATTRSRVDEVIGAEPEAIVLSPGPCTPNEAGICLDLIDKAARDHPDPRRLPRPSGDRPGLRRQGGARAACRCTASSREIQHQGDGVFRGINGPFQATRYHSLMVERASLPDDLEVTAETDDGLIMGLAHTTPAGARRAVPSRKHRLRARPSDPAELPRHRRGLERATGAAARRAPRVH